MANHHLTLIERTVIYIEYKKGASFRAIGRILSRHHTTISREIYRNVTVYIVDYQVERAQFSADLRRFATRPSPKRSSKELYEFAVDRLEDDDSPDIHERPKEVEARRN